MKRILKFKSLKTLMTFWLFILGIVPLLLFSLLIYTQRVAILKNSQQEKLLAIRDLKVRELQNWIRDKRSDIRSMAQDSELRSIEEAIREQDPKMYETVRLFLQRHLRNYHEYLAISVVDPDTYSIVVSTNPLEEGEPYDASLPIPANELLPSAEVRISPIEQRQRSAEPALAFYIPIFSLNPGLPRVVSLLVAQVDLENSLYKLLLNRTGMGETGETLIVDSNSMALCELRWYEDAPLRLNIHALPAKRAAAGETGTVETEDYRNVPVLAAYTYIPETKWGFVAKQDLSEVYTPIESLLVSMVGIIILLSLFIFLLATLLARIITVPILDISRVSREIGSGELSVRSSPEVMERDDEVGVLGRALNSMADSLLKQIKIRRGINEIIAQCILARNPEEFASLLLKVTLNVTTSQMGAFYLRSASGMFKVIDSLGLERDLLLPSRRSEDGDLGLAVAEQRIIHLTNFPVEDGFIFRTTAGDVKPAALLVIPIIAGMNVEAVLVIGKMSAYPNESRQMMEQVRLGLGPMLANLLSSEQTRKLSLELKEKNFDLQNKSAELQSQSQELKIISAELKRQNEELKIQSARIKEADRLKGEFLSNVSHELRTPLNSIISLSGLLAGKIQSAVSPRNLHYLEIIERNGKNLLNLINNLLDLSKIEAGKREITNTRFSVPRMIQEILDNHTMMAEQKELQLFKEFEPEEILMESDEGLVYQILQNLINNAVKFTETGHVRIEVRGNKENLSILISDTGIGISSEELPFIFDEFRQADGSSTRKYGGTGLGLAITKKSVQLLRGEISVESKPGEGSAFRILLPLVSSPGGRLELLAHQNKETVTPPAAAESEPTSRHILLVDDNNAAIIQVAELLRRSGFEVSVAEGGERALELIQLRRPDCIILDLMMPGIDGFSLLATIRNDHQIAGIPVLVMTAKNLTREELEILKENHVYQLVQKGNINPEMLLYKLKLVLNQER